MRLRSLCGALLLAFIAAPAFAASINYGNFPAITVDYLQVTEASVTDAVPLFGAPSVAGNTLNFSPVGFGAGSAGGGVPDITDGNLAFTVDAHPGQFIERLLLSEAGDYTIIGTGTATSEVTVAAAVILDIIEVDGVSINPIQLQVQMIFTPSGGTYNLIDDAGTALSWSGSLDADLTQALIDASEPFVSGVTAVEVNLDNVLTAVSEAGSSVSIAKKDFKGFSATAIIPEPGTALLLAAGLAGLAAAGRRRSVR